MRLYSIKKNSETIIFDIDSTLYTNKTYASEQIDVQIRFIADEMNMDYKVLKKQIESYRNEEALKTGQKQSLGNTLIHFGIPLSKSIELREKLLKPELYIKKDYRLRKVLERLKTKYKLITVTNNPYIPAFKTLVAIGIQDLFIDIISLDKSGVSKPHQKPFELASQETGTPWDRCISVGDRFSIDLEIPLKMGMGGILVTGVEEVYRLPEILL